MNEIKYNHKSSHKLLSCLFISLVAFVIFLKIKSIQSFGGSDVFFFLVGFGFYLSSIHKDFQIEIKLFSIILLLLMILNYIGNVENKAGISNGTIISASSLIVLISILTSTIIIRPLGPREIPETSDPFKINIRRRVTGTIDSGIIAITLAYTTISIALFLTFYVNYLPNEIPLLFSSVVLFWLIVALLISFIRGRKVQDEYLHYLVSRKSSIKSYTLKRWFIYILIGTIFCGLLLETTRGLWSLWLLTWTSIVLIILTSWNTWRSVFSGKNVDADNLDLESLQDVYNPKFFLIYVGILFIGGLVYSAFFILHWYFYIR